ERTLVVGVFDQDQRRIGLALAQAAGREGEADLVVGRRRGLACALTTALLDRLADRLELVEDLLRLLAGNAFGVRRHRACHKSGGQRERGDGAPGFDQHCLACLPVSYRRFGAGSRETEGPASRLAAIIGREPGIVATARCEAFDEE